MTMNIFSNNYYSLLNKYFPFVRMSKKSLNKKPDITSCIKVSIRHKDKLFKKYQENKTEINYNIYSRYKNKLNVRIKKSEKLL